MKIKMFVKIARLEGNVLERTINHLFESLGVAERVASENEADVVVVSSAHDVSGRFSKEKYYIILALKNEDMPKYELPANVRAFYVDGFVVGCVIFLGEVRNKLEERQPVKMPVEHARFMSRKEAGLPSDDAQKPGVLVVDDKLSNRVAAQHQLVPDYRLTVVGDYDEAIEVLSEQKFNIVLLDLHLPMSANNLGGGAFKLGELVEYGLLLLFKAAMSGAEYAAVVTDLNHHADPFSAAFDHFSGKAFTINETHCLLMHAPMQEGGVKDWRQALEKLTS